jgi:periplasmic divalent cation tolerance protein
MSGVRLVLCTVPEAQARPLADALLAERLVACVNFVGPITSRYVWQGAIEETRELLLLMKTATARAAALRDRIRALHGYQVPEILEFDVADGYPPYLQWVLESCAEAR